MDSRSQEKVIDSYLRAMAILEEKVRINTGNSLSTWARIYCLRIIPGAIF
ncbi:MAG: hypothetical protein U5N58_08795 [Actinomycetota bacterium]|nr:hypothetical protein [Actinomycetota bacterium]